jgi:quinol monooxygenase YgiN
VLIVAGYFVVDPAQRDQFLAGRAEGMRASRAEPGCITYAFSPDQLDPGRVLLYERWESKDALAEHLKAARAASRPSDGIAVLESEVLQYEISAVGPLGS